MGAAVTNTGSAQGCGRSWPLCNGQFVPEFTVATAIEYSHRAVTGIEGLLIVALSVAMLVLWRREREVQVLVPLMLGALVLQAGLGAAAVMLPQSPAVLASHFGISLVAFASDLPVDGRRLRAHVRQLPARCAPDRQFGRSLARTALGGARRASMCWVWCTWAPSCATPA
jgi:cytochrome c oxidase assembly protein subunit 15